MRKIIAILFSLLLVCSLSFVALADAAEDPVLEPEEVMQTEISGPAELEQMDEDPGEPCPMCEGGILRQTEPVYGKWLTYQYQLCKHGHIEERPDMLQRRSVNRVYACDSCVYSREDYTGEYEYAVYCQQRAHRYITSQI